MLYRFKGQFIYKNFSGCGTFKISNEKGIISKNHFQKDLELKTSILKTFTLRKI